MLPLSAFKSSENSLKASQLRHLLIALFHRRYLWSRTTEIRVLQLFDIASAMITRTLRTHAGQKHV